jgi:hypothetical protein
MEEHSCKRYNYMTDCGVEYGCGYEPDFPCDECTLVVGHESGDRRKGKKPWAKKWRQK